MRLFTGCFRTGLARFRGVHWHRYQVGVSASRWFSRDAAGSFRCTPGEFLIFAIAISVPAGIPTILSRPTFVAGAIYSASPWVLDHRHSAAARPYGLERFHPQRHYGPTKLAKVMWGPRAHPSPYRLSFDSSCRSYRANKFEFFWFQQPPPWAPCAILILGGFSATLFWPQFTDVVQSCGHNVGLSLSSCPSGS